jgi:hypothetical protein
MIKIYCAYVRKIMGILLDNCYGNCMGKVSWQSAFYHRAIHVQLVHHSKTNVFKSSTVRNCHRHAFRFFILFHPQPEVMAAKYRLSSLHYDGFYNKLVRPKLTDFLIDERERQRKEKTKTTTEDTNVRDEAYHV